MQRLEASSYVDETLTADACPDGIIRMRWAPGIVITGEVARHSVEVVEALGGAQGAPLLVDMNGIGSLTRDARQVYGKDASVGALALVGQSPVSRVLATFALRLQHPTVPTRFFAAVDEAEQWLLSLSS